MTNKKALIILLTVTIAVSFFEILNLTKVSLWHDESFSALLVKYDFSEMITRIKMDVHPPLYYIVLRGWTNIFTNSLFSLRMCSAFFSFLAIFSVYFFTKQTFRKISLALFASLLYTLSYFQIQYAIEARMYALGTFLVVASSYLFLRAIESKSAKWWFLYAASVSLGIYVHYFVAFWIAAHAIYLICLLYSKLKLRIREWLKDKNIKLALLAYSLVFVSYIPWLPTFLKQLNQVGENYWIPPMDIWSVPNTIAKMALGDVLNPGQFWYLLLLLLAATIAAIIFFIRKTPNKEKWFVLISFIFPFFITALLSYERSIYIDRYFIFGFPCFLIFWAGVILVINKRVIRNILISLSLIGALATFPVHWIGVQVEKKPGMAAAASYVNENAKPDEKIFVGSSLIYFTFKYYNNTGIYAKLYAPGPMPHFSGTALLSKEDIIIDFDKEARSGDIVWMLNTTGFGNFRPEIPVNWVKEEERGFQEVNDYQGWIIISKYKVK